MNIKTKCQIPKKKKISDSCTIETSPGFAQLLGEKLDFQNDVGKKSLNGESLEMNDVISRSFLIKVYCCKFILRK